ncbi:NAD(P)-binding protein [Melanomma pulvis-pyrius CBS 109.77]|uniref:NAD(P)-binding protein n=1 Tax=Melanomma pulvis-pyrius CBS 109.77 TaxID=1314802 RepID=A0A6A6X6A8_9PLEO|nr:NAD(P)-binding protein [Melanomma pulvis-pyrius CBS 109.77]
MFLSVLSTVSLVIGAVVLLIAAYQAFLFLSLFFLILGPDMQLREYKPLVLRDGVPEDDEHIHWALITGSSGGIGFGYAHHLLSLGFGVIILAHVDTEVQDAEARLRTAYPDGSIKGIVLNCQTASISDIEALVASLQDLPVSILINNVGGIPMEFPHFRLFAAYNAQGIDSHYNMNVRFMVHLTRLMLPLLTRNAQPRALILNITSAARFGLPYLSMYSATKAYMTGFSHALTRELKLFKQPVDCLLIIPGDVLSDGNCIGVEPGSPTAMEYAQCVLERVDGAISQGRLEISPFWKHAIQISILGWLPESLTAPELAKVSTLKRDVWAKEQEKKK